MVNGIVLEVYGILKSTVIQSDCISDPLSINLQAAAGKLCPLSLNNRGVIARLKGGMLCSLLR